MKRIFLLGLSSLLVLPLLMSIGCGRKEENKRQVVEVPTARPEPEDTVVLPEIDIAMMSRSLVDALRMGERLDSASYNFYGILTDGEQKPLYTDLKGKPGKWRVEVQSPNSVVIRNLDEGNLLAEDLRVYVAQAIGLTDSDVVDAGVVAGNDSVQAVIYSTRNLRMELTLQPVKDKSGQEYAKMTIAFIRR